MASVYISPVPAIIVGQSVMLYGKLAGSGVSWHFALAPTLGYALVRGSYETYEFFYWKNYHKKKEAESK